MAMLVPVHRFIAMNAAKRYCFGALWLDEISIRATAGREKNVSLY
jgi:hypothetical protein